MNHFCFSSKNLLDEHINTHTGVRPYVCEICGKDFASKYTYKAHVKTHEVRPRPFQCSRCSKTFLSQQNLNRHEETHNGVKEYVCHQCGEVYICFISKTFRYSQYHGILFLRSKIIRFPVLSLMYNIENCINNSSYNDRIAMVLIMVSTLCVHTYIGLKIM